MNPVDVFRDDVIKLIRGKKKIPLDKLEKILEKPPENIGSDLALPCFTLNKKNPVEFAKELANKIKPSGMVKEVNFYGPYVNFYADWIKLGDVVLKQILKEKDKYGSSKLSKDKIMVEFAHPNTHKAFHIGHMRNISLGESLCRTLEYAGHKVFRTNYQGDIGPHVAKCIWGFLKLHKGREPKKDKGKWLGKAYKEASERIAKNTRYEKEMREINTKLYSRDKSIMPVWKKTRQWSLDRFDEIYNDFGVKFNRLYFESETEGPGKEIVMNLLKKRIAKESRLLIMKNILSKEA